MSNFLDDLAEENRHLASGSVTGPETHLGTTIQPQEFNLPMDKKSHHSFERVSSGAEPDVHIDDPAPEAWVVDGDKIKRKKTEDSK